MWKSSKQVEKSNVLILLKEVKDLHLRHSNRSLDFFRIYKTVLEYADVIEDTQNQTLIYKSERRDNKTTIQGKPNESIGEKT